MGSHTSYFCDSCEKKLEMDSDLRDIAIQITSKGRFNRKNHLLEDRSWCESCTNELIAELQKILRPGVFPIKNNNT